MQVHRVLLCAAAALLAGGCERARTESAPAAEAAEPASRAVGEPVMQLRVDGRPWAAVSIRYHVDEAFNSKEYAHSIEARAADGSRLDMIILCHELTLAPRSYPGRADEEVSLTFSPPGRSAGSFSGDSSGDARAELTAAASEQTIAGSFSATLQDLNPNGRDIHIEGQFSNIPRAKP